MKYFKKLSQFILEKKERKKAYKETMSQDIETIDTYETRTKVDKTQWRPIYEVIDETFIKESNIFPDDFSDNVKIIQTKHNLYQVM